MSIVILIPILAILLSCHTAYLWIKIFKEYKDTEVPFSYGALVGAFIGVSCYNIFAIIGILIDKLIAYY
ncbi:hypothetical protein M2140_000030 [Clostridiales Family XIII bacterium PM5-7]